MKPVWIAFEALLLKECVRYLKVWKHTLLAPVVMGLLYMVVFGEALSKEIPVYEGVRYIEFIVPGLIMMTILQNAFANSSSSLIQAKISGHLVFQFMPAIPGVAVAAAYLVSSFLRCAMAAAGLYAVFAFWGVPPIRSPFYLFAFAFSGAAIMASLGIVTALWAEKYDQMGAVQGFVVMPLTFLSGVFYSTHSLPPFWQAVSHANPFFYMVDGFRYGFFGRGDVDPATSLAVVAATTLAAMALAAVLLEKGWKVIK